MRLANPPYRPIPPPDEQGYIKEFHPLLVLTQECWAESPQERPNILLIKARLKDLNGGKWVKHHPTRGIDPMLDQH